MVTTGESLTTPVRAVPITVIQRVLDLGCGRNKLAGAVGVDRNPASQADLLCDLDSIPFPFRADSFDEIRMSHVIEHLGDVVAVMAEICRIARHGARVFIATPHFSSVHSYTDPGHRQRLARGVLRSGPQGLTAGSEYRSVA